MSRNQSIIMENLEPSPIPSAASGPEDKPVRVPVTFVLPGDGRSGGVRVTVIMANILMGRGYNVRIACQKQKFSWRAMMSKLYAGLKRNGGNSEGFLHLFHGKIETCGNLNDLECQTGEIVIAVGTYTVDKVRNMSQNVNKVRFNHGFPAKPTPGQDEAWRGKMPTITVSKTLVSRLQELTEGSVWGVVPNGVETSEYFIDSSFVREGLGALYSRHPNKAPEDLIAVLREAYRRWPEIPQHVFGTEPRPSGLEHANYTQLPSVAEARVIYNRCKVWVLASRTEGLPGVVLEAMACGCVVVSSDNDGSLEIITHGKNGLIAPRGDREAIVEEAGRCFFDEALRLRLAEESVRTVGQFTWSAAADRMEAFLEETMKGGVSKTVGEEIMVSSRMTGGPRKARVAGTRIKFKKL